MGKLNFRLGRQMDSYQKEDSTTTSVWPLPMSVIQVLYTAAQGTTQINIAISDITWVAFFFLIQPGEYRNGGTNSAQHPFRLKAVQLFIVQHPYNAATASNDVLAQADFFSLLFTTQMHGVKG